MLCSGAHSPRVGQALGSPSVLSAPWISYLEKRGSCGASRVSASPGLPPPLPLTPALPPPSPLPSPLPFHTECLFPEPQKTSQASDIYSLELEYFLFLFPGANLLGEISPGLLPALREVKFWGRAGSCRPAPLCQPATTRHLCVPGLLGNDHTQSSMGDLCGLALPPRGSGK